MYGAYTYRILVIYKRKQTSNIYHSNFWGSQKYFVLNDELWPNENIVYDSMRADSRTAVVAGWGSGQGGLAEIRLTWNSQ